jgi:hypothetical protein
MDSTKIVDEIKAQLEAELGSPLTEVDLHGLHAGLRGQADTRPLFQTNAGGVVARERWDAAYSAGAQNAERYTSACVTESWR